MFGIEHLSRWLLKGLLLVLTLCTAQSQADSSALTGYASLSWTIREGAPADVWTLGLSPSGQLWLGTGMGLFRFDGTQFDRYPLREGQRLTSNNINALYIAPDGDIWIGLFGGGAVRLRDGFATHFGTEQGLPGGRLLRFARTPDGALWAAAGEGLARFDGQRWQRIGSEWGFNEPGAHFVFTDSRGALWAASPSRLYRLRRGEQRFQFTGEIISQTAVMGEDRAGRVWLSDRIRGTRPLPDYAGEAPWVDVPTAPQSEVPGPYVRAKDLLFADDGSLWLTQLGVGVRRLRDAATIPVGHALSPDDHLETFARRQGLPADFVVPIVQGFEGEIWVGSNSGLSSFRAQRLNGIPDFENGLPAGFSVVAEGDGVLIISGRNAMRVVPPITSQRVELDRSYSAAARDSAGVLWLTAPEGAWKEVKGHREHIWLDESRSRYTVQAMAPDQHGGIWLSVTNLGVYHVGPNGSRRENRFDSQRGLPTTIAIDSKGAAWFGFDDEVVRLDGEHLQRFKATDGLRTGRTTALYIGRSALYVGGEAGFARFDGQRFVTLSADRDDALAHVSGIVEADNGDLWLNGGRGLVQVRADDLGAMFGTAPSRLNYRLLDRRDGLPGVAQQAAQVPTLMLDSKSRLWVTTNRGVAWLDPESLPRNERTRAAEIQSLRAGDRTYRAEAGLQLPAGTRTVVIRYSALTPASADRARFRYRLDGVDNDWQDADTRREAAYGNLGAGEYRFRVVAANSDGVWSNVQAELPFSIDSTVLESRSFLIGGSIAALLLCALAYRLRARSIATAVRKRLEARHLERERIARELHDTLLQGTQGIIVNIQGLVSRLPKDEPMRAQIETVLDRADDVVREAREKVHDLRTADVGGVELARSLDVIGREMQADRAAGADQMIIFRAVSLGDERRLDRAVFDQLLCIAREALRNAFQHARATQIEVEIEWGTTDFALTVRDDGVGIPTEWLHAGAKPGHWGLVGMRERAEGFGGRLTLLSSQVPAGTEVQVRVSAQIAYVDTSRGGPSRAKFCPPV